VDRAKASKIPIGYSNRDEAAGQIPARLKAQELLCEILPEPEREQFLALGFFDYEGKRAAYRIFKDDQTEIYLNGSLYARACLQLTIPAPSCDRMIAEYLILSNDEQLYWNKANIDPAEQPTGWLPVLLFLLVDIGLLVNLAVWIWQRLG